MHSINFKRLLVPFDPGGSFMYPFKMAEGIAKKTGASITLLNLMDPIAPIGPGAAPADTELFIKNARMVSIREREVRNFVRGSELPEQRFNIIISSGENYKSTIIEQHQASAFDLIILPDVYNSAVHSQLAIIDLFRIIKKIRVPVLLVNPGLSDRSNKKIVLPLRNLDDQLGALPYTIAIAKLTDAKINVLGLAAFDSTWSVRKLERKIGFCQDYLKTYYPNFEIDRSHVNEKLDQKTLNAIAFRKADLMIIAPRSLFFRFKFYFNKYFRISNAKPQNSFTEVFK